MNESNWGQAFDSAILNRKPRTNDQLEYEIEESKADPIAFITLETSIYPGPGASERRR